MQPLEKIKKGRMNKWPPASGHWSEVDIFFLVNKFGSTPSTKKRGFFQVSHGYLCPIVKLSSDYFVSSSQSVSFKMDAQRQIQHQPALVSLVNRIGSKNAQLKSHGLVT